MIREDVSCPSVRYIYLPVDHLLQITTDQFIDVLIGKNHLSTRTVELNLAFLQAPGNTYHAFVSIALPDVFRGTELRTRISLDVYNKIDAISLEQMDKLAREDHTVVISCELGLK